MSGDAGVAKMEKMTLACLPTRDAPITVDVSVGRLDALMKKDLYKFVGTAAQKHVQIVRDVLVDLSCSRQPQVASLQHSAAMRTVVEQMELFCTATRVAQVQSSEEKRITARCGI